MKEMGTKTMADNAVLYDQDFYAWGIQTAQLIRDGQLGELALEVIAEEIEDMAKRERKEVLSRMSKLVMHLLRWKYQAEKRSWSWRGTISEQRRELDIVFDQSPSLRSCPAENLGKVYKWAVRDAVEETGLAETVFPTECPFTVEQILDQGFRPED